LFAKKYGERSQKKTTAGYKTESVESYLHEKIAGEKRTAGRLQPISNGLPTALTIVVPGKKVDRAQRFDVAMSSFNMAAGSTAVPLLPVVAVL